MTGQVAWTPMDISWLFLQQYYFHSHQDSAGINFYESKSKCTRGWSGEPRPIESRPSHPTADFAQWTDIHLDNVDCHAMEDGGQLLIVVSGWASTRNQQRRRFMQTFVLSPSEGKEESKMNYFVLHDILRILPVSEESVVACESPVPVVQEEQVPAPIVVEKEEMSVVDTPTSAPAPPAVVSPTPVAVVAPVVAKSWASLADTGRERWSKQAVNTSRPGMVVADTTAANKEESHRGRARSQSTDRSRSVALVSGRSSSLQRSNQDLSQENASSQPQPVAGVDQENARPPVAAHNQPTQRTVVGKPHAQLPPHQHQQQQYVKRYDGTLFCRVYHDSTNVELIYLYQLDHQSTVYVQGLADDTTVDHLTAIFSIAGVVRSVDLLPNKASRFVHYCTFINLLF